MHLVGLVVGQDSWLESIDADSYSLIFHLNVKEFVLSMQDEILPVVWRF